MYLSVCMYSSKRCVTVLVTMQRNFACYPEKTSNIKVQIRTELLILPVESTVSGRCIDVLSMFVLSK